jgi:mRNA interferase RelE/StbE
MRALTLTKSVLKELDQLPAKQYRQVVGAILDLLVDPKPHYSRQLRGSPYLRIAVGEYRVVYRYTDDLVALVVCGKRNDDEVYAMLNRAQ